MISFFKPLALAPLAVRFSMEHIVCMSKLFKAWYTGEVPAEG